MTEHDLAAKNQAAKADLTAKGIGAYLPRRAKWERLALYGLIAFSLVLGAGYVCATAGRHGRPNRMGQGG
jgi:hypothetical protein